MFNMMMLAPAVLGKELLAGELFGRDGMDMDMDAPKEFHPVNAPSKTFHWLLALFVVLLLPSVSSSLAFANRLHWSLVLQMISTAYSVIDTMFLSYPDPDGHENRTSKGTGWFLSLLLGCTIFVGTLINGSNLIINKFYPQHSERSPSKNVLVTRAYKTLSFLVVLTGWVRVCMIPVAYFGFCYNKYTGQCLAHGIMGSSFILYGFVLALVLVVPWLRNRTEGRPQEFYDSTVMCAWGIVNTFTEHRWGKEPWSMGDFDHTSMGLIWACGGFLGMFLSRKTQRSFIPSLLLIYTGWSMSQHVQHLAISTKVHAMFGIVLMSAGFTRIVEIVFLLKGKYSTDDGYINTFQYFPPICLVLSGLIFMGANAEQLVLVHDIGSTHAAYILTVLAAGFMIFLWMLLLVYMYLRLEGYDEDGELNFTYKATPNDVEEYEIGDLTEDETP